MNASSKQGSYDYIMIAGPTASGKSQLAIDLAVEVGGEVINADSMQLYDGLSILTARPSYEEMKGVSHHLYGVLDASYRASVAEWLKLAAEAMVLVIDRGNVPIVIGGTGMYLNSAIYGIARVPAISDKIYENMMSLYEEMGGEKFRKKLSKFDPELAARLKDGDRQRLIRGMSVAVSTGTPLSVWQKGSHKGSLIGEPLKIAVLPSREILYQRINNRFDQMIEAGALDEVRRLAQRKLDPSLPLMKALGFSSLKSVLDGKSTLDEAKFIGKRDSRHYAKRQMTWLRNNYNAQITINKKLSTSLLENIFSYIR